MARYVNAEAFDERVRVAVGFVEEELSEDFKDGILKVLAMLKTQPTADVREVVHGKWNMKPDPYGFFDEIPVCSECGMTTTMRKTYDFCPYCGADMRGGE